MEIKVKIIGPVTYLAEMFRNCHSLIYVKFINFDTSNVSDMHRLFDDCNNLTEILGIDTFDTSNVINISFLFSGCKSLINLPKTLNWDTSNVIKMNSVFLGCESLKAIPDISKWNIKSKTFYFNYQ